MPATSGANPDLVDARFKRIYDDAYKQIADAVSKFYNMDGDLGPQKDTTRFSQMGTFGDFETFTGNVKYDDAYEGYDTTLTHVQYAKGFSVEHTLLEDELYSVMDGKPRGLGTAYARTRQKWAAQTFLNSFSNDTTWQTGGDGSALCANAHTTRAPGVATTTGFDNLGTASLTAVSVSAARVLARKFRDDRGHPFEIDCTTLLYPIDLWEPAEQIIRSTGELNTANNNINALQGVISSLMPGGWVRLSDVNDWWMIDTSYMNQFLHWITREEQPLAMVEDFDTLVYKWRKYCRVSLGWTDWRWIFGNQVS
jgi:hypothetical protein